MDELSIRKAVLSDIPYLYEVCLKTGENGTDATSLFFDPYLLGHYFAAPYLLFPAGICFVVESERRPQGYLLSAPDTAAFRQWMEEQWLPPLRIHYQKPFPPALIRSEKEGQIIELLHICQFPIEKDSPSWLAEYPAHLHIDLLPSLQGKGMGRSLMETLFKELERQKIPGLHLGVSASNSGAVAFYRKLGFSVLEEHEWGFMMGKH